MLCLFLTFISDVNLTQALASHHPADGRVRSFIVTVKTAVTMDNKTVSKNQVQQYLFGANSYLNEIDDAVAENVLLSNQDYAAILKKNHDGYILKKLFEGEEKKAFDLKHDKKLKNQVKNHLDLHLVGSISVDNLLKSKQFKCTIQQDKVNDVVVNFERIDGDRDEKIRMLNGHAVLSSLPPMHCKEHHFLKRIQGKIYKFSEALSVIEVKGEHMPHRKIHRMEYDTGRSEYVFEYRDFHKENLPDSRFRLSYYGLPEPVTEGQLTQQVSETNQSSFGKVVVMVVLSSILLLIAFYFKAKSRVHYEN